jgi:hypothetical protein
MIYDLLFHYRIEKEAEFGADKNGNPCEVYLQIKLGKCNTETRDADMEKQAQIDGIPELADMLGTKPEYITPITPEEYAENADEIEGEWEWEEDCCAD